MSLKKAEVEIHDNDIVYRRVPKNQIDKKGNALPESFELRMLKSGPESYMSVNLSTHISPELAIFDNTKFHVYQFEVAIPRLIKLGVAHSPSVKDNSHSAVCGFFTDEKTEVLAEKSKKVL